MHLPAGHTAEQDLSVLRPGADVIALGFGQAFTDLVVLVTEGRGGRFVDAGDGTLRYEAERRGAGPPRRVAARRAVPGQARLPAAGAAGAAPPLPRPRRPSIACWPRGEPIEFERDLYPLVAKEVGWAYYHELFHAHGERTTCGWDDFAARYAAAPVRRRARRGRRRLRPRASPTASTSRASTARSPGATSLGRDELHDWVAGHVAADIARRTDPAYSADLGAFMGLLLSFGVLGHIGASGQHGAALRGCASSAAAGSASSCTTPAARRRPGCASCWRSPTPASCASSAPARRCSSTTDLGRFVARSASHDDVVVADGYVDARIAPIAISRSPDRLARALLRPRRRRRGGPDRRRLDRQHRQAAHRPRPARRHRGRRRRTRAASPSARSRTARRPAPSPGPARTPRRSASTTPSPARSC